MEATHEAAIDIRLLGGFSVEVSGRPVSGFEGRRARELLAYLLINRNRRIARDVVADALWPSGCGEARKKLRHVLWQVHSTLDAAADVPVIVADSDCVGIHPTAPLQADIAQLEAAHQCLQEEPGAELRPSSARFLRRVAAACSGDLLEGCYQDWCLLERERYRAIHLAVIDRLITHSEVTGDLVGGIACGETLLRHDRASERTHRRLMVMRYRNGDRTGALRQFQACEQALRDELDVGPGPMTTSVNELIRNGLPLPDDPPSGVRVADVFEPRSALSLLRELGRTIDTVHELLDRTIALLADQAEERRSGDA